ncbi:MAG: GNAT family N-acetyltransferase [Bacteroidetes bacterium]|nr:GNAT family N-acetyltransferase [Bacteroidota bacterium]
MLPLSEKYKVIEPLTEEEFDEYYILRWSILRKPWNQPVGSEIDFNESTSRHGLILNSNKKAIAVCRIEMRDIVTAQIRYMAVSEECRGQGLGRKILHYLENKARHLGARRIYLDARENAVEFYRSCGYRITKNSYLLFGEIQHYGMEKSIS